MKVFVTRLLIKLLTGYWTREVDFPNGDTYLSAGPEGVGDTCYTQVNHYPFAGPEYRLDMHLSLLQFIIEHVQRTKGFVK